MHAGGSTGRHINTVAAGFSLRHFRGYFSK